MSGRFQVRLIEPEGRRVETGAFDIEPQHEQASKVIGLMREFLHGRPPEFRAIIPFLNRPSIELEWTSAPGGVAFATIYETGKPLSMAVLTARVNAEADAGMLSGFEQGVLQPTMGELTTDELAQLFGDSEEPLLLMVVFPGSPEFLPALHLMNTALAAVFFQAVQKQQQV